MISKMIIFLNISDPGDVAMLFDEDSMDDECFLDVSSVNENDQTVQSLFETDSISDDAFMEIVEEDREMDFLNEV